MVMMVRTPLAEGAPLRHADAGYPANALNVTDYHTTPVFTCYLGSCVRVGGGGGASATRLGGYPIFTAPPPFALLHLSLSIS